MTQSYGGASRAPADAAGSTSAIFGRTDEQAAIRAAFVPASGVASPGLVLVGEAGIGKSTLWAAGADAASEAGLTVLRAAPTEAEDDLAFAVLGDLLAPLVGGPVRALPELQRRALDIALGVAEPGDAVIDQRAVGMAVAAVLTEASRSSPVVLAIDDLQWADAASAAALAFAWRRLPPRRALVLAAARLPWKSSRPFGWPFPDVPRLTVQGLSLGATHHLLSTSLNRRLSHLQARRLHDEAGGNPLHALELARSLPAEAPIRFTPDAYVPAVELQELLRRRIWQLPEPTRETLLMLAAARRPTVELLGAAGGAAAVDQLVQAEMAGLVVVDGDRVRFRHPLYATVCYRTADAELRRRVHLRLAAAATDPERRAPHLALGTAGADADVAAELDEAALLARARGAPDAAAELAQLAAAKTPAEAREARVRRVIAAAGFLAEAGDPPAARAVLERELHGATGGRERCRILLELSGLAYEASGVAEARARALEALDHCGEDAALRAEAQLAYVEHAHVPVQERLPLAESALQTLRGATDVEPALLALALREVAVARYHTGHGMPRALIDEVTELEARMRPLPPVAWRAATILGECLKYLDGFTEARRMLANSAEQAEHEGDIGSLAEIALHRAELELWLGNWSAAHRIAQQAVTVARDAEFGGRRAMAGWVAGLVAAHRGDVTSAAEALDEALRWAGRSGDDWVAGLVRSAQGFLALARDEVPAAIEALAAADADLLPSVVSEPRQWRYLPDYIQALVATGELETASDRLRRLEQWAARAGGWASGMALRSSAMVREASGDRDGALGDARSALEIHIELPLPFERARAMLTLGAIERRAGRRRDARTHLSQALEIFAGLGAPLWSAQAERELARISGRPATSGALTPAEQAVARLVATGATNRQIAGALSVSTSTVEAHLTRIYGKLGIHSRAELIARER